MPSVVAIALHSAIGSGYHYGITTQVRSCDIEQQVALMEIVICAVVVRAHIEVSRLMLPLRVVASSKINIHKGVEGLAQ